MHGVRARRPGRRGTRGQDMVEFSLIAPLLVVILWSMIYGGFLVVQNEQVISAARSAARSASIEAFQGTLTSGPGNCEAWSAGQPDNRAATAVRSVAFDVPVNGQPLCSAQKLSCTVGGSGNVTSVTLDQATHPPGLAWLHATAAYQDPTGCTDIVVTVQLTYHLVGLAPPFNGNFTMQGLSTVAASYP